MDLEELQELQEVDLLRDDANRTLQAILEQIEDPPFVEALDAEIEAQAQTTQQIAGEAREASAVVETAQRRIDAADERLYGGSVTNPRTLEEIQRDLYAQRQAMVGLKDANLKAHQLSEDAFVAERWLRDLRTQSLEIWSARQAELIGQRDAAQTQVDDLTTQIDARRARISETDLRIYDQYRRRRPRVVAGVAGGVCEECRLALPTMVITRARRGGDAPIECPSCGCLVRVA